MGNLNEILEIRKKSSDDKIEVINKRNTIGITIKLIGWIVTGVGIFGGLILGLLLTTPASSVISNPNPLRWVYAIAIMVSSFISGFLFIGFGEIIILLNDIRYNTKSK
ncbi:hypothetical protein KTC96_08185 [Clostridium estertheticum]|uniref:hypothetical protein n=1 Tax=Clostridium estertheticum TaxID=238834 RepID=UPI001C7DA201|nr:hypothetical protein [Clostridium estertheticum]MBX4262408.1 hypothetical protein [Clostridium estertheticum]WLC71960.1 hypothetical protein KTC96_08185 [Clostridium estertheticum]